MSAYLNGQKIGEVHAHITECRGTTGPDLTEINKRIDAVEQKADDAVSKASAAVITANTADVLIKKKQDALESGVNIKTINSQSLLGAGDIRVTADTSKLETDVQAVDQRVTNQGVQIEEAMKKAQNAALMASFAANGLDKKQNILEFATTQDINALF